MSIGNRHLQRPNINASRGKNWNKGKAGREEGCASPHTLPGDVKKEEPTEERALDAYFETRKSMLYEQFVAKPHEEREEQRQAKFELHLIIANQEFLFWLADFDLG